MASKVTIEVEAILVDEVSGKTKYVVSGLDGIGKAAGDAQKELDKLAKKKAHPVIDVENNKFLKKMRESDNKIAKFAGEKATAVLDILDKGTAKINKAESTLKSITKKTWSTVVNLKDKITSPLKAIKNSLFSMKSLVVTVTGVLAIKKTILEPINLADQYSSTQIGFSTLLGESEGQAMMDSLDQLAKATPFKTSGVISSAQKMMAYGWDAERIVQDMETIGDAAAATGKGTEGLESIVYAMSEIRSKGKLSTQELNQLAGAGIKAKAYLAEGLGYGTSDEGMSKLAKDLESGAIGANQAIELILQGMEEFDGMMDRTANETVEGLWSQITDTFEINIFRKWGQGLQDGAKRGFGSVVKLLDEADGALEKFGGTVYEIGSNISNWVADKFENAIGRILEITDSFEFSEASLGEKISMLWKGVIADPLKEWWEDSGRDSFIEAGGKFGTWLGESITKGVEFLSGGILSLLGMDDGGVGSDAGKIGREFWDNFTDAFDWESIKNNIVAAINGVWDALPWWAKLLVGGYGVGKVAGGISNLAGGILNVIGTKGTVDAAGNIIAGTGIRGFIGGNVTNAAGDIVGATGLRGFIGSTGNAMVGGTGVLGGLANAGYALTGGLASGAGLSGAAAAGIGAAGIGGGIIGGAALIKGGIDLYKASRTDDETEAKALKASGGTALAATAAGAAIGTAILPGLGSLIGAGIGGLAGWIGGDAWANNIRAAKYESEEMKEAIKDSDISAEELAQTLAKAKWENAKKHFGDIKLSLSEIERLTDQIVWGDDMATYDQFTASVNAAEAAVKSLKSASETADKWMWKASLGITFSDDEKESIIASFDEYITAAKNMVENKHYEFTAAVSLLIDTEAEAGKSILDSGNAYYGGLQEQLNDLGGKLSDAINKALEDGVISTEPITLPDGTLQLSEAEEIANLQEQIATITEKVANAEQQAELNLINVKFGNGNLDYDSFGSFMEQMQATIDERMQASDKAFVASVSSLNLQLEEGAITQDEYDKQYQALLGGYTATVEGLQAKVTNVELSIIGEAYAKELGDDAVADLNNALQYAIEKDLDPINISDEKMAELLGNLSLDENGETIKNLKEMLSGVLGHLELLEIDGNLMLKVGEVTTDGNVEEKVKDALPETVEGNVNMDIYGDADFNPIEVLPECFGISPEESAAVLWRLIGMSTVDKQVEYLASEFGIPPSDAETILWKLTGEKQILKPFSLTALDFGIKNSYPASPIINVTPRLGTVSQIVLPTSTLAKTTSEYRGGIVGGSSALESFARGGMVRGGSRLIEVAEEGTPEMIIPLGNHRRDRAVKLWAKTGEILNVPGFKRGGIAGGNQVVESGSTMKSVYRNDEASYTDKFVSNSEVRLNKVTEENAANTVASNSNQFRHRSMKLIENTEDVLHISDHDYVSESAYHDGGIVRGGSQLIRVAEEGSPEMIIPLGSHRRDRALKLWEKAGEMLDIPGFKRGGLTDNSPEIAAVSMNQDLSGYSVGGMTRGSMASFDNSAKILRETEYIQASDESYPMMAAPGFANSGMARGNQDEGIRFHDFGSNQTTVGQTVQIDVGGITFEIQVNATDGQTVAEAIRAQSAEIAETVAGIMADAFGAQFENTPVRGGVA